MIFISIAELLSQEKIPGGGETNRHPANGGFTLAHGGSDPDVITASQAQ